NWPRGSADESIGERGQGASGIVSVYRTGFRWPMNLRKWFKEHSLKLVAIRIFFGFTPLVGLKTLLSIFFAWLTRCNIVAAAIAVTLHDVALPFMPVLFRWEYRIGYWLLSDPHQWPARLRDIRWSANTWRSWTTFLSIGRPLLLGSVVVSAPVALFAFWITRSVVLRHR